MTTRPSRPTGRHARPPGAHRPPTRSSSSSSPAARPARPKGVVLTHDNVVAASRASIASSRRWTTGSCRCCRSATCSNRRSGCTTRSTSGPTSCTSAAATRGSSSTALARAPRHEHGRRPPGARPVLVGHRARGRQVGSARRLRSTARDRPTPAVRRAAAAVPAASIASSAGTSGCSCRPGRSCRRPSWRPGRTSASRSSRATARPRPGPGTCTTLDDHGPGTVGRAAGRHRDAHRPGHERDPVPRPDGLRRLLGGPRADRPGVHRRRLVQDRGSRPARRRRSARPERTDQGHHRPAQRLQRVPRGHRERAARRRPARHDRRRDASPAASRPWSWGDPEAEAAAFRATVDAAVKAANASLGPNQRIAGWRTWPDEDFPRTHTLKVKRDPVRRWASGDCAAPGQRRPGRRSGRRGRLIRPGSGSRCPRRRGHPRCRGARSSASPPGIHE